jgi:uncharacterized membrane protein YccC
MASPAQFTANRSNAQLSTGPRTEEGKDRVRHNARTHGLTSKTLILPGESEEEYNTLEESFLKDLKPANETERALIKRVTENYWRLQRLYRAEADFFRAAERHLGTADIGELFLSQAGSPKAALFLRYLTAAERAYNRSLADLHQMQTQRRKEEAATANTKLRPVRPANGFVSQAEPQPVAIDQVSAGACGNPIPGSAEYAR